MIELDVCGWCKRFYREEKGELYCEAYPDGQPTEFCSSPYKKCNGNIGLEVSNERKDLFEKIILKKGAGNGKG